MKYTYWLPNNGTKKIYETDSNSIIIIGANGSGKSKLGAWIETQNFEKVHRIGAQRNLNFNLNIPLKNYEQAESLVFYGSDNDSFKSKKDRKWHYGKYTTTLVDDYENVLSALLAMKNFECEEYLNKCKQAEKNGLEKPSVPTTIVDKLQNIWNKVFPQRELVIRDSKFYALLKSETIKKEYPAYEMSDGERAVLYLVSQVLCVPKNKVLIIDEPEVHLHRSIMNKLWKTLEQYRPDCLFIYITHDTEFASIHGNCDKIWIKEFDGSNWKFEHLKNSDIPEELLLDILGNRNNILFVEGSRNSFDTLLYTAMYPQYYVIPCGSCSQVISRTKVFNNNASLHHLKVFGIIDRDYRSDYEIEKYKKDNIFAVNVAEVENLFLVEELIRLFASHMGLNPDDVFTKIKKYVVQDRFKKQINSQICQSVVSEIKYKLSTAEISKKNEFEAKDSLNNTFSSIDFENLKRNHEAKFNDAFERGYKEVIKVFNEKGIVKSIGHYFGLKDDFYCSTIVNLLYNEKRNEIIEALSSYLPNEIPK